MKKEFLNIVIVIAAISLFFVACDDNIDPEVTELKTERAFSPSNLDVKILQSVNARLLWDERDNVASYTVEFYTDTINITEENLFERVENILPEDLPYTYYGLPGDTAIYAQVNAISVNESITESRWNSIIFKTKGENIFSDPILGIGKVTLNWLPGVKATKITVGDDISYELSDEEIASSSAVIDGLDFKTAYKATIYNKSVVRGELEFTSLPDGVVLNTDSNIEEEIAQLEDGKVIVLEGGVYGLNGNVTIDKNISFVALDVRNRPTLNVQFVISDGVTDEITISGIDFVGNYTNDEGEQQLDAGIQIKPSDGAVLGNITFDNCTFTGHKKSLLSASSGSFSVKSLTINNCVATNINSNGGDFIDIRKAFIEIITITNNTFNNCAYNTSVKAREFIRYDGASKSNAYDDGTNTPTIILENNTLYKCSIFSEEKAGRLFYVRWENTLEVISCKNNIFSEMPMVVYYTSTEKADLTRGNNYFYNAVELLTESSGGIEANPGYTNPEMGDFTVSNQDIIDYEIGASRWR